MARIVFLSVPAYGHLNPVLPIIAELVRRGHAVTVFDERPFEPAIRATGADFVAYPKAMSMEDMAAVLMRGDMIETFELFVRASVPLYDFCLKQLKGNRPDALVIDGIALWGDMVGRRLRIPTIVTSAFFAYGLSAEAGSRELPQMLKTLVRRLGPIVLNWVGVGLRGVHLLPLHWPLMPVPGDLTLMLTSRQLHPPSPVLKRKSWVFVGATIDPRTRSDVFDFSRLDGRPVIYVSLGTLIFGKSDFYERCVAALGDYPAQVLMSVGRGTDLSRFADAPKNFIVANSFPQLEVLQHADMFISPAGLNSVHEALWYGVPMLAVPQHYEQLHNAEAMHRGGAGIILDGETDGRIVSPQDLRAGIETLAADLAGYKQRAAALGQTLREGGGYVEAANRIETMIRTE
ncbi:MAG: nucleotide disphospho-sugar-binding domain-containing protein [Devosia sp.]